MRSKRFDSRKLALVLLPALIWVGCTEREAVTDPETAQPAGVPFVKNIVAAVECTANVSAGQLVCETPERLRGVLDPRFLIVGGQDQYVTLTSVNVSYNSGTEIFSADVRVTNHLGQLMGTPDGLTQTGVRVFFHTGPSVANGSGTITVNNPDGFGDFTGTNQPFHFYDEILSTPAFSPEHRTEFKTWLWDVPTTVNSFVFSVFVQADVPGEGGYVQMSPTKAFLAPTDMQTIIGTARTAVGNLTGNSVTFATSDMNVATVGLNNGQVTAVAGGRAEITATTGGSEADGVSVITVDEAGYQIEVVFLTPVTPSVEAAFASAAARWEGIITGDLSPVSITTGLPVPLCGGGPIDEFVDDVVIRAVVGPIDGVGNTLGQAGPCFIRTTGSLPAYGVMIFDEDDLAALETDGQLEDVIIHEMGHVLGYGTLWPLFNLLLDQGAVVPDCATPSLTDPYFDGALANTAFDNAGGGGYVGNTVPVEDQGEAGTRCFHWRETVHDTELMTGFIEAPLTAMPLSAISIQSMADMGYTVDVGQADAYMLPGAPLAPVTTGGRELVDDIWRGAVYTVDESGNMVEILPDRRPEWLKQLDANRSR